MINWNDVTENLHNGKTITVDPSIWNTANSEYKKIYDAWINADFNIDSIKWINFYPDMHFDMNICSTLCENLNINMHRAWISRLDPGYFAPWHWDIDDKIQEYKSFGPIRRFSIFIGKPHPAHFFVTDDTVFSNTPTGTIYEWRNFKSWHAGANAGLYPKYMLHLLGY